MKVNETYLNAAMILGLLALPLRKQPNLPVMLGAGIVAGILFHLVTGLVGWLAYPLYPKNLIGLEQSLWSGPANSPIPSWVFLRNLVCANLLFTGIFVLARQTWPRMTSEAPLAASANR